MKKLLGILGWVCSLNFLLIAAALAYLAVSAKVDPTKLAAAKAALYGANASPTTAPTTGPSTMASEPSLSNLSQLISARADLHTGSDGNEAAVDVRMAELDRRERDIRDLQAQVESARELLLKEREQFEASRLAASTAMEDSTKLAGDKGFKAALELYQKMGAKQVKNVFMQLPDDEVVAFLSAMQPRSAAKIIKEFDKSPTDQAKIQAVLEKLRDPSGATAATPFGDPVQATTADSTP